jgi:hypothetical protein
MDLLRFGIGIVTRTVAVLVSLQGKRCSQAIPVDDARLAHGPRLDPGDSAGSSGRSAA